MTTILVTSRSFGSGALPLAAQLEEQGHELLRGPSTHDLVALAPLLARAEAWIAGTGPVSAEHLDLAPRLRVVARYGVGTDAVDLAAAHARGVVVTSTPGANSDAVADHALALMLAALRSVADGDRRVRAGDWTAVRGRQLGSLRVALVGFGRVGRGVAERLRGFGSELQVVDPVLGDAALRVAGALPTTLEAAATEADIVSLHAPGGRVLIDEDWLRRVERPIRLINTARADLIDERALAAALREGTVTAFAADTLAGDTAASSSPLLCEDLADRVTVTPHLGAQTVEAVDAMGASALEAVRDALAGRRPRHQVLPPHQEVPS